MEGTYCPIVHPFCHTFVLFWGGFLFHFLASHKNGVCHNAAKIRDARGREAGRLVLVKELGTSFCLFSPQLPKIPMPDLEEPLYMHPHDKLLFIYWCDIALWGE